MDGTLENLLGALSLVAADRMHDAILATFDAGGQTPAALASIGAAPGITGGELRAVLGLSQPGTARLVERLHEAGLVEKRGGTDARQAHLHLTARGRRMRRKLLDARQEALGALTSALTAEERETLQRLLHRMLQAYPSCEMDKYQACRLCDQAVCEACPIPAEGVAHPASGR